MKSRSVGNVVFCLGMIALFPGPSSWAQAETPAKTGITAGKSQGARLLRDIRNDAEQVRSGAEKLNTLAADQRTQWADYDRQWNEIQPSVEDMEIKLARLENIKSTLSAAESKDFDQSKQLVREIRAAANGFLTLLDKRGAQMADSGFKTYARSLMNESGRLEGAAKVS